MLVVEISTTYERWQSKSVRVVGSMEMYYVHSGKVKHKQKNNPAKYVYFENNFVTVLLSRYVQFVVFAKFTVWLTVLHILQSLKTYPETGKGDPIKVKGHMFEHFSCIEIVLRL